MHHTLSAGLIVSTFIGLAVLTNVSFWASLGDIFSLLIVQMSMGSLKNDALARDTLEFDKDGLIVLSSSLSEEDDDDAGGDGDRKESSELSVSGDCNRGVARTVFGEAVISTGGNI